MLARAAIVCLLLSPAGAAAQSTAELEQRAFQAFLDDRPRDAIPLYVALVEGLSTESARRDEALVMLAAMFADLDWDHDGAADAESPLTRLTAMIPPDRAWLGSLVFATARALHLTSHDPESIALTAEALARWPVPASSTTLEAACRRHRVRPTTLHHEGHSARATTDAICARLGA